MLVSLTGCAGLLAGHPMDTIKVRQQTLGNVSAIGGFVKTFKYEGVSAKTSYNNVFELLDYNLNS